MSGDSLWNQDPFTDTPTDAYIDTITPSKGTLTIYGSVNAANITSNISGTVNGSVYGNVTGNLTGNVTGNVTGTSSSFTGTLAGDVTGTASTTKIANSVISDSNISSTAAIQDSKLAQIISQNKVANTATTATPQNTPSTIIQRDANGAFTATTINATTVNATNFNAINQNTPSLSYTDPNASNATASMSLTSGTFTVSTGTSTTTTNRFSISPQGAITAPGTITSTFAGSGAALTSIPGSALTGSITSATLPTSQLTGNITGSTIAGSISNATLPTSQLTGTIPGSTISGSISNATLPTSQLTGNIAATTITGSLDNATVPTAQLRGTISGAIIQGSISSATLPTSQLSGNIPASQVFGSLVNATLPTTLLTGTIANSQTSATAANTDATIVLRDVNNGITLPKTTISGALTATSLSGPLTGAVTGNLTGNSAGTHTGPVIITTTLDASSSNAAILANTINATGGNYSGAIKNLVIQGASNNSTIVGIGRTTDDLQLGVVNTAGALVTNSGVGDVFLRNMNSGAAMTFHLSGASAPTFKLLSSLSTISTPLMVSGPIAATTATFTAPNAQTLAVLSGAANSYAVMSVGKTAATGDFGIAGGAGNFFTNSAADDICIRNSTSNKTVHIGAGGGASQIQINSSGIAGNGALLTNIKAVTVDYAPTTWTNSFSIGANANYNLSVTIPQGKYMYRVELITQRNTTAKMQADTIITSCSDGTTSYKGTYAEIPVGANFTNFVVRGLANFTAAGTFTFTLANLGAATGTYGPYQATAFFTTIA